MSLINDALKRARESQAQAAPPPPPALEFRPVEPTQMVHRGPSLALIATVCIAIVLAALLLWQFLRKSPAPSTVASVPAVQQAPAPAAVPAPAVAVTPAPAPATAPLSAPAKVPVPASVDPKAAIAASPEAVVPVASAAAAPVQVASAAAPAVEPVPPKPAPPKLQAIVFRKTRPSAMISGKTLFVGDKFGDWRLVAITEETATLVGAGVTNVLVLPQ
jgi:hypothetical protein